MRLPVFLGTIHYPVYYIAFNTSFGNTTIGDITDTCLLLSAIGTYKIALKERRKNVDMDVSGGA